MKKDPIRLIHHVIHINILNSDFLLKKALSMMNTKFFLQNFDKIIHTLTKYHM